MTKINRAGMLLLFFTLITTGLSQFYQPSFWLIITVIVLTILKGQQITDVFMELQSAPAKWRFILLAYALLMPLIVGAILYL